MLGTAILAVSLAACSLRPRDAGPPEKMPARSGLSVVAGETPYRVSSRESRLIVLVYRAGPLARAGHNHVIASHDLSGTFLVHREVAKSRFELFLPVSLLTVDEPRLRAAQGPDFPPDLPDSAREGTRRNMLSPAVLDAGRYPQIRLRSERLRPTPEGVDAQVQVLIRDQVRTLSVPVSYTLEAGSLRVTGELTIRQTDLGLTPFSALFGALQVRDAMSVKFDIRATAAPPQ
jgi:hypothetical protein